MPSRFSGIRGDSMNNWDLAAIKAFDLRERLKLQFRTEFVNAFNHVMFDVPNTTPSSTNFGVINGEVSTPRVVQFSLRLVF